MELVAPGVGKLNVFEMKNTVCLGTTGCAKHMVAGVKMIELQCSFKRENKGAFVTGNHFASDLAKIGGTCN